MTESERPSTQSPPWWLPEHQSAWDRVKAAFRRDWEQTKANLSRGRQGVDLNQNIGDTVGQVLGNTTIPEAGVPNPMNATEQTQHVRRAGEQMLRTAERFDDDSEKSIARNQPAPAKSQPDRGWVRFDHWEDAERPLRFGHGAASEFHRNWDEESENRLRLEWLALYPDEAWDDVRDTVRQGWDGRG